MNTGEKNTKGRVIYKGPRGGLYVLTPGGSRVTKFTKAAPPPPSEPKNDKGRIIYKGPKGGLYVLDGKKKVYTFKASENNRARATAPSPKGKPTTVERLAVIRARLAAHAAKIREAKPKSRKNIENRLRLALARVRARQSTRATKLDGVSTKRLSILFCQEPTSVPRKKCIPRKTILPVYTGTNPLIDSGEVVAMHERDFDKEWFDRQSEYVSKLNDYDLWTLQAHTNRSHGWIGPYTYAGTIPGFLYYGTYVNARHITPLWPQVREIVLKLRPPPGWMNDFVREPSEAKRYAMYTQHIKTIPYVILKEALDMYTADLKRIIAGAPKAKKKMILYRGTGFDIFQGTQGHRYKLRSFCSAAYNVKWAARYGDAMLQRITVLPGTPVLLAACTNQWTTEGEYEVMVNIDTHYLIRARNVSRGMYYDGKRIGSRRITDVIIAK